MIPVQRNPLHFILDANAIRRALGDVCTDRKIDAVISYWQEGRGIQGVVRKFGALHGVLAAASYRQWLHGSDPDKPAGMTPKALIKRTLVNPYRRYIRRPVHRIRSQAIVGRAIRDADFVVARSKFTRQEVVELFGADEQKVAIAHCGIDDAFRTCTRQFRTEPRTILYVGALVARKGIFDALDAFARLRSATGVDYRLRIAGWGNQEPVASRLRALKIDAHASILGGLDRDSLIRELLGADLGLMPSYSESFGLAVAEAQATGLPVVAYDAGAVPEVLENGRTGWLAQTGDIQALADALLGALESPEALASAGEAAAARAGSRFTWRASAEAIIDTIRHARTPPVERDVKLA